MTKKSNLIEVIIYIYSIKNGVLLLVFLLFFFHILLHNSHAKPINDTAEKKALHTLNELPLITIEQLEYIGGFRIKSGTYGQSRTGYTAGKIAYNSDNHSLFLSSHTHHKAIAEFKIPQLLKTSILSELPISDIPIQNFSKVLSRPFTGNKQKLNVIGGMEYINGELLVHAYQYYDADMNTTHTTLVVRNADDLKNSRIDGYFQFAGRAHGVIWISPITDTYKVLFNQSDYLSGASSSFPINGRASMGPSAFAFKSSDIINTNNQSGKIDTLKLLDFHISHIFAATDAGWMPFKKWKGAVQYNYSWDKIPGMSFAKSYDVKRVGNNHIWTEGSGAFYGIIIPGTRTYAVFGTSSMNHSGGGYKITQKNGRKCPGPCSYDPNDRYNYYWFFDVNELVKVKAGLKQAYEVRPYSYGLFETPFDVIFDKRRKSNYKSFIKGGTYNSRDGIIYFALPAADPTQSKYEPAPIIIGYKLGLK